MKITLVKKIGNKTYPFSFDGADLFSCIIESKKLSFQDVDKCGICGSDELKLDAYVTKEGGYKYTIIRCKCGAKLTFGQPKQAPETFYLRRKESGELDWTPPEQKEITEQTSF